MRQTDSLLSGTGADADRELLGAIAAGSTEALGALYDRYAATVFGLARRITRTLEDAEEVVQDVFAQVWRQASRYEGSRASVAGWLVMLTRTRAIDRLRSRQARPDQAVAAAAELGPLSSRDPDPEALTLTADEARHVRRALDGLPSEQRSLVELAYFEGLTHSEIAAQTNTPLGTVKTRIRTAMTALRSTLSVAASTTGTRSDEGA